MTLPVRAALIATLATVLLPGLASAQTPAEVQVLTRVIDVQCFDLVEARNGCETAILLVSETEPDAADLLIISDRRAAAPQEVLAVARGIAFNGYLFGQAPALEQAENGSLRLVEEQIGIGRAPWTNVLTIAHRDGAFVVAGRSYSTYDRIVGGYFSCDVNFLTGDWTAEAERPDPDESVLASAYEVALNGQIAGAAIPLAQWSLGESLPSPCQEALNAWWEAEPQ